MVRRRQRKKREPESSEDEDGSVAATSSGQKNDAIQSFSSSSTTNHTVTNTSSSNSGAHHNHQAIPQSVPGGVSAAGASRSQEEPEISRYLLRSRRRRPVDPAFESPSRASVLKRRRSTGSDAPPARCLPDQIRATNVDERQMNITDSDDGLILSMSRPVGSPHPEASNAAGPSSEEESKPWRPQTLKELDLKYRDHGSAKSTLEIAHQLGKRSPVAVMLYQKASLDPVANDNWLNRRDPAKMPARYQVLDPPLSAEPTGQKQKICLTIHKVHDASAGAPIGRSKWNLPVELVEQIASHLTRDDIKALRMVSRDMDFYVAQVMFKTVVVPFNTEIYGMLESTGANAKGKQRAARGTLGYAWTNKVSDEIFNGHGLDVFKGFGKHIMKFGMSFEVTEASLSYPPAKKITQDTVSFWGRYEWPYIDYKRFDAVAGLETAADETPRMTTAFSQLTKVKELALSVDSGLGWLNGPDQSIRSRILQRPSSVFKTLKEASDRQAQAHQELWEYLEESHQKAGRDIKEATLYRLSGVRGAYRKLDTEEAASIQPEMPYIDLHLLNTATPAYAEENWTGPLPTDYDEPGVLKKFSLPPPASDSGIIFTSNARPRDSELMMSPIIPSSLTQNQKEWLLETQWAQDAFLTSYMLSIMDNGPTFANIHTLNISRLSANYLTIFNRSDFWDGLPNMSDLTLMVIPCWRTVSKDAAGFVDVQPTNPAEGVDDFHDLVENQILHREGITKLTLGWVGGGEHTEGVCSRNRHILPAPLMPLLMPFDEPPRETLRLSDRQDFDAVQLCMPHVEHLTLKNCWITPHSLLHFVERHDGLKLKHLTLDSVSLTAILAFRALGNNVAAMGQPVITFMPGAGQFVTTQQAFPSHAVQNAVQGLVAALQPNNTAGAAPITTAQQNLQQQLHQHLQQFVAQHQNGTAPAINLPAHHQVPMALTNHYIAQSAQGSFDTRHLIHMRPREGSWTFLIDRISPGTNLKDFGSLFSSADPNRETALRTIEFISCGYAKLPYNSIDQGGIEEPQPRSQNNSDMSFFNQRRAVFASAMQRFKWPLLGEVVQNVDVFELTALEVGWDLKTGWDDEDEARAVEFDGLKPGGTGRFSGFLRHSDRVE